MKHLHPIGLGKRWFQLSPAPLLDYVLAQNISAMIKCTLKQLFRQHVVEARAASGKKRVCKQNVKATLKIIKQI